MSRRDTAAHREPAVASVVFDVDEPFATDSRDPFGAEPGSEVLEPVSAAGARRWIVAVAACALVLAAFGVAGKRVRVVAGHPAPVPSPTSAPVIRPVPAQPSFAPLDTAPEPSNAIQAAFADWVPGAYVTDENTQALWVDGASVVVHRELRAVSGNVEIVTDIDSTTLGPAPRTASTAAVFHTGGYVITFTWTGYYAPTLPQLRALADDPRLTALPG